MRDGKILAAVVNDLSVVRESLKGGFELEDCGIEVWDKELETVAQAVQAIPEMVEDGVDVVLLDASLDSSGLYVLAAIREQASQIKVIGLSSKFPFPQEEGLVVDVDLSGTTRVIKIIDAIKDLCLVE